MNIAYFGSPDISATLLGKLVKISPGNIRIPCVFTQPDKPAGKNLTKTKTPVAQLASKLGLALYDLDVKLYPTKVVDIIKKHDIELCISYSYGLVIPLEVLRAPRFGFWNIHFSLLPEYRGPAPVAYALILGDNATGTTISRITDKLDSGEIISQKKIIIDDHENRIELTNRLALISEELMITLLSRLIKGEDIPMTVQDEKSATYTKFLKKDHGHLSISFIQFALKGDDLSYQKVPFLIKEFYEKYKDTNILPDKFSSAKILYQYYRGLSPWPGIWTVVKTNKGDKRLKILKMKLIDNKLVLMKVQLEGKNPVLFEVFNKSYNIF
ncbi:hypothetical protein A3A93_04795 [Candidatus Roizmanbacteria bacterium RIFCSPLOWO2_01_FULL_38_12]|uniref:methionyl-tRNA formyltransferase n=1 Tax=Candidatus Roizmanbacteria bacterium RIFCSPLOWO2_01_FULL_38_12 TaxID=1802061 RepID=A0A1F7IVW5_9BACT|nr:MAG: hypothetical protein A3F59_06045 [Candidatus Roizmanbacteria bacterium RIFCSPHIGHO2_12_FULL_38_13]OGK47527.1 MAG: hypothetical protein A3A93_04795 [Candidatus Roizmanbacteria bacterium RIFCSPLOWO2_01_FULL_38_12]